MGLRPSDWTSLKDLNHFKLRLFTQRICIWCFSLDSTFGPCSLLPFVFDRICFQLWNKLRMLRIKSFLLTFLLCVQNKKEFWRVAALYFYKVLQINQSCSSFHLQFDKRWLVSRGSPSDPQIYGTSILKVAIHWCLSKVVGHDYCWCLGKWRLKSSLIIYSMHRRRSCNS